MVKNRPNLSKQVDVDATMNGFELFVIKKKKKNTTQST